MSFIKNIWYVATWSDQVESGKPKGCVIADTAVVLYRKTDGVVVALEDRCSHRCAPLSKGRVEGDTLRCWYHGLLFGENGECLETPGQDTVPKGFDIKTYPVVEMEGWIWIWLGDSNQADTALIPSCGLDDGGIDFRSGVLEYSAHYELINDNLCDLSHVAYVHESTLARGATDWVQRKATITNIKNGVRVTRWIPDSEPLPLPGTPERVDIWSYYEFYAPGIMSLLIAYYPVGTATNIDFADPTTDAIYALRTTHAPTPTTENKTSYHFGVSLPLYSGPNEVLDAALGMVTVAFQEDKDTIEAQQRSLDRYPGITLRNTVHDGALTRIRRLISSKIKDEQVVLEKV